MTQKRGDIFEKTLKGMEERKTTEKPKFKVGDYWFILISPRVSWFSPVVFSSTCEWKWWVNTGLGSGWQEWLKGHGCMGIEGTVSPSWGGQEGNQERCETGRKPRENEDLCLIKEKVSLWKSLQEASLLSESRMLDLKISDRAIELSVLGLGKVKWKGSSPGLRWRDFEISR